MVMDDPLDFEEEDLLLPTPRPAKRKKVIGLDDLLNEYRLDQRKASHNKSKRPKGSGGCNSDDEDTKIRENEINFCKFVENCEKQVDEMDSGDDVSQWGQKFFGRQRSPPACENTGIENCELLQCLSGNELSVLHLGIEQGDTFLEGLLMDGWLWKLVLINGSVEDSVAHWTFNKMLYSSNEKLSVSACDFWDSVLFLNEADKAVVNLAWFPSYPILKDALISYGYLHDTSRPASSTCEVVPADSLDEGPPQNIISWLRVVSACCKFRKVRYLFSTSEAEDLLVIVISLFLDRKLEGFLFILSDGLKSLISYFEESEWHDSCIKVAESIAHRVTLDLNCLRIVECITGANNRSKGLRIQLALQLLRISFGIKAANGETIFKSLRSINVKEKRCNFFKLYVYLVLADNLLLSGDAFQEKALIIDSWCNYLRNCSSQIGCTDWRPYASKVRNKASYLLQTMLQKKNS